MNISELNSKVLTGLRTHGWCKNTLEDSQGRMCLIGAAYHVDPLSAELNGWKLEVVRVANEQFPERMDYEDFAEGIVSFNNDPQTTWDDIEMVLEKVGVNAGC